MESFPASSLRYIVILMEGRLYKKGFRPLVRRNNHFYFLGSVITGQQRRRCWPWLAHLRRRLSSALAAARERGWGTERFWSLNTISSMCGVRPIGRPLVDDTTCLFRRQFVTPEPCLLLSRCSRISGSEAAALSARAGGSNASLAFSSERSTPHPPLSHSMDPVVV